MSSIKKLFKLRESSPFASTSAPPAAAPPGGGGAKAGEFSSIAKLGGGDSSPELMSFAASLDKQLADLGASADKATVSKLTSTFKQFVDAVGDIAKNK